MSNFTFLAPLFPKISASAKAAERFYKGDPRTACFHARRCVELWVYWVYDNERTVRWPDRGDTNLNTLLGRYDFQRAVRQGMIDKAHAIRQIGNDAVHGDADVPPEQALIVLKELYQLLRWHVNLYIDKAKRPQMAEHFNPDNAPEPAERIARLTAAALRQKLTELEKADADLQAARSANADLQAQLDAASAELARIKAVNAAEADSYDYSEADTRTLLIDVLLREAGWNPAALNVREYPVTGMPTPSGNGFADYVLWGDNRLPMAVIEAKKTTLDPSAGRRQAELYADCLEQMTGQRPLIFYSNGYQTYLWDDANYPPRRVSGFYSKDDLERLIQRRTAARALADVAIDKNISGRYYQEAAIRHITDLLTSRRRKALLVMATGTGKTRTAIGLVDLLQRASWAKRVLFLADRTALVKQAASAFKAHLPASDPVNLLEISAENRADARSARIVVSTYHTILNRLDKKMANGMAEFGVGHFDLVIIDEAHRSVFRKFRAIFDYFDSLLIGLTATPKDEIERNTYELFELETGVPTYAYDLNAAVGDKFLVPPVPMSIPSVIMREGLRYDELSAEEQAQWDELDWGEGGAPERVRSAEINQMLFNKETVDLVLLHLMTEGIHVENGDRLGKTIVFARNQAHAEYIQERFDANYPKDAGHEARIISYKEPRAQSLIDDFKQPGKFPDIAISVDMLDTGIDIPDVVNLVFFKRVFSPTKFNQMIGRGTRLRPNLFGPGDEPEMHKREFYIFDFCENFEYFNQVLPKRETKPAKRMRTRIFEQRLALLQALGDSDDAADAQLAATLHDTLHGQVAAMPLDNFIVRPQREHVERYTDRAAWDALSADDFTTLASHVADLPSSADDGGEMARRFDLLMLNLQIALLNNDNAFVSLRDKATALLAALETSRNIPMVGAEIELIEAMQSAEWWTGVTVSVLDDARQRLRGLVHFVTPEQRTPVYTDFADQFGEARIVRTGQFAPNVDYKQYRDRVEHFIRDAEETLAVKKLVYAQPLTEGDLDQLEELLFSAEVGGSREQFESIYGPQEHLGPFIRSLTGLDRGAAKARFATYLDNKQFNAQQIDFVNFIIDHLVSQGRLDPQKLFEPPFTDMSATGPGGLFEQAAVVDIVTILRDIEGSARPREV